MGLFGKLFKSDDNTSTSGIKGDLVAFLKQVDELYMEAYSAKSTRNIAHYMTPQYARTFSNIVTSVNVKYFGDSKYRHTNWSLVSQEDNKIKVKKEVTFDKVKVAGKLAISVATDYSEVWTIVSTSKYLVSEIKAI